MQYLPSSTLAGLARAHAEWDERHAPAHSRVLEAVGPRSRPRAAAPPGIRLARPPPPSGRLLPGPRAREPRPAVSSRWSATTAGRSRRLHRAARGAADRMARRVGLADDALAARIRADRIDILFDLSGHTGGPPAPGLRAAAGAHPDHLDRLRRDDRPGGDGLPDRRSLPRPPRGARRTTARRSCGCPTATSASTRRPRRPRSGPCRRSSGGTSRSAASTTLPSSRPR